MIIEDGLGSSMKVGIGEDNTLLTRAVVTSHFEEELHHGHVYAANISNSDMDKSEEINICFTTPVGRFVHAVFDARCSIFAEFKIGEGATVTGSTGTDATALNSNRPFADNAIIESTYSGAVGKFTKTATVTNDGTIIHTEMLGSSRQGAGAGTGSEIHNILKQGTTYAFRIVGNGVSGDNGVASLEIIWFWERELE